jgi:lysophospholipase L1-like esterase
MAGRVVTAVAAVLISSVVLAPSGVASAPKGPVAMFYLSLGDSYAAGFEVGAGSPGGYASKVVAEVATKHKLLLRNFGCGGATTNSMMEVIGCADPLAFPDVVSYPKKTQLAAALAFIATHHRRIGLITVSIGGNDLNATASNVTSIAANITIIAARLRAAAGRSVPIIGLTYPDVVLADWLTGPSGVATAEASISAFQDVINPDWQAAYASSNVTFVDVTAAFGAYTPLVQTVSYSTYGEIPYAVAQICILTGTCGEENIHPTNAGYSVIAKQIVHAYLTLDP